MFSHLTVGSNDLERSRRFYDALFSVTGGQAGVDDPWGRVVYFHGGEKLVITPPIDGKDATPANGGTIGFAMRDSAQVAAWHSAGAAHGGTPIEQPPGVRETQIGDFYLAYLRDPDGNKLCAQFEMGAASQIEAGLSFGETVRARRSVRAFLPEPLSDDVIRDVLREAQMSPSNCNTQPWSTHVVSGAKRDELARALHAANDAALLSPDFSWDEHGFSDRLDQRRREQGANYYTSLGATRDDLESRAKAGARNFSFFDAPHVALLFMPVVGDSVRVAGDLGMYGQTLLLALAARGLGGVPQTALGFYAQTVRDVLGVSDDLKLLYGISFGHPDENATANSVRMGRDDLGQSVTFHS